LKKGGKMDREPSIYQSKLDEILDEIDKFLKEQEMQAKRDEYENPFKKQFINDKRRGRIY